MHHIIRHRSRIDGSCQLHSGYDIHQECNQFNGLKVKLPMEIQVDNKLAKALVNNWSVGGRTRHIGVRLNYLQELKEKGVIKNIWISLKENVADILTKNLPLIDYTSHTQTLEIIDGF
jgi:hypothetical protein